MVTNGFKYEISMSDLKYKLFGKKECPRCKARLVNGKHREEISGAEAQKGANKPFFAPHSTVQKYTDVYTCPQCNVTYTIAELMQAKGKK